jgi:hypothetical protein
MMTLTSINFLLNFSDLSVQLTESVGVGVE